MDAKQRVKSYICGFPKKRKLVALALFIAAVGCVVFSVLTSSAPEPVPMENDAELSSWVCLDTTAASLAPLETPKNKCSITGQPSGLSRLSLYALPFIIMVMISQPF